MENLSQFYYFEKVELKLSPHPATLLSGLLTISFLSDATQKLSSLFFHLYQIIKGIRGFFWVVL